MWSLQILSRFKDDIEISTFKHDIDRKEEFTCATLHALRILFNLFNYYVQSCHKYNISTSATTSCAISGMLNSTLMEDNGSNLTETVCASSLR